MKKPPAAAKTAAPPAAKAAAAAPATKSAAAPAATHAPPEPIKTPALTAVKGTNHASVCALLLRSVSMWSFWTMLWSVVGNKYIFFLFAVTKTCVSEEKFRSVLLSFPVAQTLRSCFVCCPTFAQP